MHTELGENFTNIVEKIFKDYGFEIKKQGLIEQYYCDVVATIENLTYYIETKFTRTDKFPDVLMYSIAQRMKQMSTILDGSHFAIIVVNSSVNDKVRKKIENENNITVIDIKNLLWLVENNEDLKNALISMLDFSINDIIPKEPNKKVFRNKNDKNNIDEEKFDVDKWIKKLNNWDSDKQSFQEYETLCFDILKYLFFDELALWRKQQNSNSELYRFDLICKIKDGNVSGFWTTTLQCLNSKYIIFEFKNYKDEITQREVYTTDKYLYIKALRGIAILISPKGASENANKAMRGTFRENGKLILSISNDDLVKMIDIKINNGIPADYLYDLFDNLLIDLEK